MPAALDLDDDDRMELAAVLREAIARDRYFHVAAREAAAGDPQSGGLQSLESLHSRWSDLTRATRAAADGAR